MLRWLNLLTRKHQFINPIRVYSWHRQQIANDFPVTLPPEEDEDILTTTTLLAAVKSPYQTEPMKQLKKASTTQWQAKNK